MENEKIVCPCKRTKCSRHGDCDACREHHLSTKGKPTACERAAEKAQRAERRNRKK